MAWTLVAEYEERAVRLPMLGGNLVLGSGERADVRLDHATVSRRHAELVTSEAGVWLTDLGSSNGTRLEGVSLEGRTLVRAGQRVHFGSLRCYFERTVREEIEAAMVFETPPAPESAPAGGFGERDPDPSGTMAVGTVRDFVSTGLPELVAVLEAQRARRLESWRRASLEGELAETDEGARRGADAGAGDERASARERTVPAGAAEPAQADLALVQVAGQALFHSFPCRGLELVELAAGEGDDGVLFRAGLQGPEAGTWQPFRAGRLEARVCFSRGLHVSGVEPLIEMVVRLVALEIYGPGADEKFRSAGGTERPAPPADAPLPKPPTVDPALRRIFEEARRVARGDVGVLIAGESGTGKEVLARFVHACSPRAGEEWVALNCAALPQDLLEAELFGIERGVATGVEARAGKFEQAHGGTLFLDEIGDMAAATQAKILRVLQEGEVYRLGGSSPRPARVRVIAATNRDLVEMIDRQDFRLDLYHRIADCRFTLPPLRERLADLPNLAAYFLMRAADELGVQVRGISKAALETMMSFAWPGNVRQLEREMARAALFLEDDELLQSRHLHDEIQTPARASASRSSGGDRSLKARLESYERGVITEVLMRRDGNVRAAAEELGIGRTTLYRRLQELQIEI